MPVKKPLLGASTNQGRQFHLTSFFATGLSTEDAAARREALFAAEEARDRALLAKLLAAQQAREDAWLASLSDRVSAARTAAEERQREKLALLTKRLAAKQQDRATNHLGKPIAVTSTSVSGTLYVGSFEAASNSEFFDEAKIGAVVNCTKNLANVFEEGGSVAYRRVAVEDAHDEQLVDHVVDVSDWIGDHLVAGRNVLVHCLQGKSRSVTVCAAYLMLRDGCRLRAAYDRLVATRPSLSVNDGFASQLESLDRRLFGSAGGERDGEWGAAEDELDLQETLAEGGIGKDDEVAETTGENDEGDEEVVAEAAPVVEERPATPPPVDEETGRVLSASRQFALLQEKAGDEEDGRASRGRRRAARAPVNYDEADSDSSPMRPSRRGGSTKRRRRRSSPPAPLVRLPPPSLATTRVAIPTKTAQVSITSFFGAK